MSMEMYYQECKDKMGKAIENFQRECTKLRTGRASSSLVEDIKLDYYGMPTPLNQLASIATPDSRTITIQPWDKGVFALAEKAILKSDLGLNPVNDGRIIRIALPVLTEERRKELTKVAKGYAEDCKVAIRNIRRDFNDTFKKMKNEKEISEDDQHRAQDEIQNITDEYIKRTDDAFAEKEAEIMEI